MLYVNFGFWDAVHYEIRLEEGHFNKKIENKVKELNGKKSLYSTSFYAENEFWSLYGGKAYFKLKTKYDRLNRFRNLYEKAVKRK